MNQSIPIKSMVIYQGIFIFRKIRDDGMWIAYLCLDGSLALSGHTEQEAITKVEYMIDKMEPTDRVQLREEQQASIRIFCEKAGSKNGANTWQSRSPANDWIATHTKG